MSKNQPEPKPAARPKPRTPQEIEEILRRLRGEYDYYCGVTSQKEQDLIGAIKDAGKRRDARKTYQRRNLETCAAYRSKIKALYWALGQGEL